MKRKINKKNIKNYCLLFLGISYLSFIPSLIVTSVDKNFNQNSFDNFTRNTTNSNSSNFALTNNPNNLNIPNNIIMPNVNANNNLDLESAPLQHYATDNVYFSGYALLTSSNFTVSNYDQITKFSSISSNTGLADWIVKKTDLGRLISVNNSTELKINSINFVLGDILNNSPSSLMVLVNSTNATNSGTYLFRIVWDGTEKGKYELISKVGNENYNFMLSINSQLSIYNLPKISNGTTSDLQIKYVNVNVGNLPPNFPTPKNITISRDIINSYFSSQSLPFKIFNSNNNIYIIYQSKISALNLNSFFTVMQISQNTILNNLEVSIVDSSIAKINLETLFTGINSIFDVADSDYLSSFVFENNATNSLTLLMSQSSKTQSTNTGGNYATINFDLSNLFTSSPNIIITTFNYPPSSGYYFFNVKPLYSSGSNRVLGYIAIASNNFAVELGANFEYKRSLYNFDTAQPTLGKIYNIYTKPLDQNWYAQMVDTKIAQMYSNSLIGQWDKVFAATSSLELPAIINVRPSTEVLDGAIFTKVANNSNNAYSSEFTQLMLDNSSYSKFLNVIFTDPKLGNKLPDIKITYSNFVYSSTNNYSIELTFTQTLRTLDANGSPISGSTTSSIQIAKSIFNFINAEGSVLTSNSPANGFEVPLFVKTSLPSAITYDIAFDYLLRTQNILNPKLFFTPDDLLGTLSVDMEIPYMWVDNNLTTNTILSFSFGTDTTPYFSSNPLSQQDISVTLFDNQFLSQNPIIKRELVIKYGGLLPSEMLKSEVLDNFVRFGSAFSDEKNDPYISKLTTNDINFVALDSTGELFVEFSFVKLGNQSNVRYSFTIKDIFLINPTANDSVFFVFKDNNEVLSTDPDKNPNTTETYRDYKPTQIVSSLTTVNNSIQLDTLSNYANFSSYFSNILNTATPTGGSYMTISAETDDASGFLTVIINLENPLPNSSTKVIQQTFTGFRKEGNVIGSQSSFQFNDMRQDLLERSATSITEKDLFNANVLQISGQTGNLNREITLLPINEAGTLSVTVKFYNWVDFIGGITTIVPIKEFSRTYIGFPITKPALNAIIWKSFMELDASYRTLRVNDFVNTITQLGDNHIQLKILANISDHLDNFLLTNPSNLEISYAPNDANGSLAVNISISGLSSETSVNNFSTIISGFVPGNVDIAIRWTASDSDQIQELKNTKFPSDINEDQVGLFYSIASNGSFLRFTNVDFDDVNGSITIEIIFTDNNGLVVKQESRKFDGFRINKPSYKGTDWSLIAIMVAIPFAILLLPLLIIILVRFKIDKRKVIKKLNARIDEQNRKTGKTKTIKSTKDLID